MPIIRKNKDRILLPDYTWQPNFVEIEGCKIHFVAEGKMDAPTILFLHGVPTWSFTFRKILPVCIDEGYRIIAPDLPGFGKSDKPSDNKSYSLEKFVECMAEFIWRLELQHIVLFAHDWGAIIGMVLAAKCPEHFAGIITCNGLLPVPGQKIPAVFHAWKRFAKYSPVLPVGEIVNYACNRKLSKAEKAGYNYPFSKRNDKLPVRVLPGLVPLKKGDNGFEIIEESWKELGKWEKPFLTVFSNNDPVTKGGEKILQGRIPGTKGQPHKILNGKHFLQEDAPEKLGEIINAFVRRICEPETRLS
ncbi:MAG: haloalkane dehalogenase [Bacteroidota bacterium]